ncbi:MAG TPA: cbb3-type cytochrome oxidase assembly protein CcoS [Marinobacterium sp.]|nr:cbb3-type cytochrome oxidase assembly protein CcoS [Marinobacterium sp.]
MDIIYLLIPIAIVLIAFGTWAFFWSVNTGQFDDLDSPAHRILYDDDEEMIPDDAKIESAKIQSKVLPKTDAVSAPNEGTRET